MTYAGCSRPASGVEHYFSHVWDMRALEYGTPCSTHGFQCQVGAILAARIYERLRTYTPDRQKAIEEFEKFSYEDHKKGLQRLVGKASREMIMLEEEFEHKYDCDKFIARIDRIIEKWDEILEIIKSIPTERELISLLDSIGSPSSLSHIGIDDGNIGDVFEATRDIRDKYVLSRLIFDLGLTNEAKKILTEKE